MTPRLWTYSTPVPPTRWEHIGDSWRTTIAPTAPETRMDTDPHTDPPTADSGPPERLAAPVPDELDAAKELNAEHDRIALADVDRLMSNAFERWRLIHDLANIDPQMRDGDCCLCGEYLSWDDPSLNVHRPDCLWLRANQLTNEVQP
jgi:hypothetical protein